MTLSGFFLFAGVYALAVASPGPGVAAVVARALARGSEGLGAFIAGFVAGDLIWFGLAAAGLSLLAQQFHLLFLIVKYAGAAYLVWLAWTLWIAPPRAPDAVVASRQDAPLKLFTAGLALTLGNPKVIVFFMAILPTVVDLHGLTPAAAVEIGAAMAAILSGVLAGYGLMASRARRLFASPRALKILNRACGATLAGAAAAVATR
ncbi:MAG: lysine transporter LysE [Rhizobiales bacterium 65-9]|nr:LysE family translocator [Hyphomicrobiales bacterium]OJY36122.1 MAG: lysine transporter LysE [Rhizobiales bacterium 65-9]